jgi:hypothetical protein
MKEILCFARLMSLPCQRLFLTSVIIPDFSARLGVVLCHHQQISGWKKMNAWDLDKKKEWIERDLSKLLMVPPIDPI